MNTIKNLILLPSIVLSSCLIFSAHACDCGKYDNNSYSQYNSESNSYGNLNQDTSQYNNSFSSDSRD